MGSGLPGSLPSYLLYYIYLYISYVANKIVVVTMLQNYSALNTSIPPMNFNTVTRSSAIAVIADRTACRSMIG